MVAGRDAIADALVRDLVGPSIGEEEVLEQRPSEQYLAGAVYPIGYRGNDNQNEDLADPMQQTTKFYPSAMGLSVMTARWATLDVTASIGIYTEIKKGSWLRKTHKVATSIGLAETQDSVHQTFEFGDITYAAVTVTVRRTLEDGRVLVTAMIVNRHVAGSGREDAHILFQAGIKISASEALKSLSNDERDGLIGSGPSTLGEEEEDLAFLYREAQPLAHGHGTSVDWSENRKQVWTETIPRSLVHGLRSDPSYFSDLDLSIENLIGPGRDAAIEGLIAQYASWIQALTSRLEKVAAGQAHGDAALRVAQRQADCLARMRAGQRRLSTDTAATRAWGYALQAMMLQFQRPSIGPSRDGESPRLRPFQIAYLLLVLPGLGPDGATDPSRKIVDLLWFPTGGGKTEAYLLVVLVEAFLRRIHDPKDSGCVALSRYTYRMLAFDQFSRAASAICAAELVRSSAGIDLGAVPFSVGLWIGGSQTPNQILEVDKAFGKKQIPWRQKWLNNNPSFPLVDCPWCGVPLRFTAEYLLADAENVDFALWCSNSQTCPFGNRNGPSIPISVVDDHIYRTLPTIVVATADKLAQLPVWSARKGPAILRGRGSARPVSILVFDELHLLSGPLGTIASLYEIAVDAIATSVSKESCRPKILASTATIRTAGSQVKGLLGRPLETFPVSGDDPDDSFWAVKDDRPETARLYLGAMTSGSTWQALYVYSQTSIFRSVSKLPSNQRNPYWTSVIYAGTLRDHGRTVGLIANDVRSRLTQFDDPDTREIKQIEELRGDRVGSRLPQVLAMLKRDYSPEDNEALDAVVTTNLIQVGVDVPRLGLMIMLGQPKGTAEYIQASSRVGRTAQSSGLVFTLFQHTRPRDRSHYEDFKGYHSALYRAVEPISVTPLAEPALERSIRAVFASIARHAVNTDNDADAKTVGSNNELLKEAAQLIRAAAKDRDDGMASAASLDRILDQMQESWHARAVSGKALMWSNESKQLGQFPMLLAPRLPPSDGPEWPYDYSMRNVEASVNVPLVSMTRMGREGADE